MHEPKTCHDCALSTLLTVLHVFFPHYLQSVSGSLEGQVQRKMAFVDELKQLPVAVQTAAANEQHYEIPTEYFLLCLGQHLKYSCCLYTKPGDDLNTAEVNMLSE